MVDGEVHFHEQYESVMKLYDIPYRLIKDEGQIRVAMTINKDSYRLKVPGKPSCGGWFCFQDRGLVFVIDKSTGK